MIHERIEIHLECDTQEEVNICVEKLTSYGYEVGFKDVQYHLLATKHLVLTKEEI